LDIAQYFDATAEQNKQWVSNGDLRARSVD
jgi:hypothetical protein